MHDPLRAAASTAGGNRPRDRAAARRVAVAALVILLGGCAPLTPSPRPSPSGTPGASPSPSTAVTLLPAPSPAATAAPTPATAGWTAVGLPTAAAPEASLRPVAGAPGAADPSAGFLLTATAETPLADLVARVRVEPALAYRVVQGPDARSAILRPPTALAAGAEYRFTLVDGTGATLAGWAFQVAGPPRIVGTLPRDQSSEVPVSSGIEVTFDRDGVAVRDGDIIVRIAPDGAALSGRIETHGRTAAFVPAAPLLPDRVYQVTVRAGSGAASGQDGLAHGRVFAFQTARDVGPDLQATLDDVLSTALPDERPLLHATAWLRTTGQVELVRTPLAVRVYRLAAERAALDALARLTSLPPWTGAEVRPPVATAGLRVAWEGMASFVADGWDQSLRLPKALAAGWYLVELVDGGSQALLQVTDLVAVVGARQDHLFAWANDARTGAAVAGASVDLVGGRLLGRTDSDGLLVAATPASPLRSTGPILVRVAARDGRHVVLRVEGQADGGGWGERWVDPWRPGLAAWWSAFSSDRSTYRSTDTIEAWGYLRKRADGTLPGTITVRLWPSSDGPGADRPLAIVEAKRSATGAFTASLPINDLPLGWYILDVTADGEAIDAIYLQVDVLRKPPYGFDLAVAPRAIVDGDTVTAATTTRFFDGTPAAEVPVVFEVGGAEARATTDGAGVASGTLQPRVFSDDDPAWQLDCPSVVVRTDGASEGSLDESRDICIFRGVEHVDATATRDGEALVVGGAVHTVDLAAAEAALRAGLDPFAADWRGAAVAGRRVELRVTEHVLKRMIVARWYDPVTKLVTYQYEDEEISSTTTSRVVATRADGTFRARIAAPSRDRSWEVAAVVTDAAGHVVEDRAWIAAPPAPTAASSYALDIAHDDRDFAVGDTVTAAVEQTRGGATVPMPAGGVNRYLFLVLGPTRFDAVVRRAATASVRFAAADEPLLQVSAAWFDGRGTALLGPVEAKLRTEDRTVTVAVTADRARYEPGDTARLEVRTSDPGGRPVSATVLVRAVDEKLVAIGAADLADPVTMLYRYLDVGLRGGPAASHPVQLPGGGDGKGSTTGGGGGDARADFRDFLPLRMVTTGADGLASLALKLPDDITGWRVAATAITADRRAGTTSTLLPVGLPFFVDATIAPEYLVGEQVGIRLRAFGSALAGGAAVRFTVGSTTLAMAPLTVAGRAFEETIIALPPLVAGTQQVEISATSAAGEDRLVRTFRVVPSRLAATRRVTVAVSGSVAPPGGPGMTTLELADAGRARYAALLDGLAQPAGTRADELLAASLARGLLVTRLGRAAADVPVGAPYTRSAFQSGGGLALLPYAGADLELTVRALLADPEALVTEPAARWLRGIAGRTDETAERRAVALAGLAVLGEPTVAALASIADDPASSGRARLWAAIGLAVAGDRERAAAVERAVVGRWGERRGDLVRLRISDDPGQVADATGLLALLAAWLGDPLAQPALAYLAAEPPPDDLPALTQVTVVGLLLGNLAATPAAVAIVEDGARRIVQIPAGSSVTLHVSAAERAAMSLEPVAGSAAVTASWEDAALATAELGRPDLDLTLARAFTPASPVAADSLVRVALDLHVGGPGRDGVVEVVDLVPSGLAALEDPAAWNEPLGRYEIGPSRIEGQRVTFTVPFRAVAQDDSGDHATVPGTFHLVYHARVVTAGTYRWEPAVARQAVSPGMVAVTPPATIELR